MKIIETKIKIKELLKNVKESDEVTGLNGTLNIRPLYQREFVYSVEQEQRVINTIFNSLPLNSIYFSGERNQEKYELIDGQQRILSIIHYNKGYYNYNNKYYDGLSQKEKEQFLNYSLYVFICYGTEDEKLKWFETINIAGEKLTKQELRNAVYCGEFITEMKEYFSKNNCPAMIYKDYFSGKSLRQEWLETILKWSSRKENLGIDEFCSKYRNKPEKVKEIWEYIKNIFSWVEKIYPFDKTYNKFMKGLDFAYLFDNFKGINNNLRKEVLKLMEDEEVENKKGIFIFLLDKKEKHLNLRTFSKEIKQSVLAQQEYKCAFCDKEIELETAEADHIKPWSLGGKTNRKNYQVLCRDCNRKKGNRG